MIGKLLVVLTFILCAVSAPQAQTLDEVYKQALTEGGTLNFYATLAQVNAASILPAFEKRFPGIRVNHVDATSDQLAARVIAESRGGKVIIVTDEEKLPSDIPAAGCLKVPKASHFLTPVVMSVPLQMLAYYIAVLRGTDVDQPRNLAKSVTVE